MKESEESESKTSMDDSMRFLQVIQGIQRL